MEATPSERVRRYVGRECAAVVDGVDACADAVAETWDDSTADGRAAATGRAAVVPPMERCLQASGVLAALPGVLVEAVAELGASLPAAPVPAPPYVVVTSTGPVVRATLSDGRLVVGVDAFAVERAPRRYVRRETAVSAALR